MQAQIHYRESPTGPYWCDEDKLEALNLEARVSFNDLELKSLTLTILRKAL